MAELYRSPGGISLRWRGMRSTSFSSAPSAKRFEKYLHWIRFDDGELGGSGDDAFKAKARAGQ
jgi:hypothetical protein